MSPLQMPKFSFIFETTTETLIIFTFALYSRFGTWFSDGRAGFQQPVFGP
jgi:hypothetical protein